MFPRRKALQEPTDAQKKRAAFYQAASACLCVTQIPAAELVKTSIIADAGSGGETQWQSHALLGSIDDMRTQIVVHLSGAIAEQKHAPKETITSGERSLRIAHGLARQIIKLTTREKLEDGEITTRATAIVEQLRSDARALVDRHWESISRIAHELFAANELSGSQVKELIEVSGAAAA